MKFPDPLGASVREVEQEETHRMERQKKNASKPGIEKRVFVFIRCRFL
jgi:hypothetical protein